MEKEISNLSVNQKLAILRKSIRFIRPIDFMFKDKEFKRCVFNAEKTDASLTNLMALKMFGKTLSIEEPSYTSLIVFPYSILKHIIPIKDNKIIFGSFPQTKIDITSETDDQTIEEKVKQEKKVDKSLLGSNPRWYGYEINKKQLYIEHNCVAGENKNLYYYHLNKIPYEGYIISPIEWDVYPEYDMVISDKILVSKNDNPNYYLSSFITMITDEPSYSMLRDSSLDSVIDNLRFELEYFSKKYNHPDYIDLMNRLLSDYQADITNAIALTKEEKDEVKNKLIGELNGLIKTLKKDSFRKRYK